MQLPIHIDLPQIDQFPWTISYVLRKMIQLESFETLPKEKRPPDEIIWWRPPEELDKWFDKVYKRKPLPQEKFEFIIDEDDIG